MEKKRIRLLDLLLIGSFGIMLAVAFEPRGPPGRQIGDWREHRRVSTLLQDQWDSIFELASSIGRKGPGPQILEVSDYQCPYCRRMHEPVSLLAQAGVRVGYLHFPLSIHPRARAGALAAICAEDQGFFPEMHDYLMRASEWMDGLPWEEVAVAAGVPSISEFIECLASGVAARRLAAHMQVVRRLGVRSTPTFITKEEVRSGTQTVDELRAMLSR